MPPVLRKLKINKSLTEEAKIKVGYSNQGTTINGLPFDCFYLIFHRFDLRTQILNLRTVCHIWHDHITQICASKSHLTLRPYFKPLEYYHIPKNWFTPRDLQQYVTNREAYCNDLEFRLPKIDKLTTNSLINHTSLFGLFANNLNELTLNFDPNYNHVDINVDNVLKLIKSFGAFSNLHTFSLHISCVLIENIFANNHQTIHLFYRMIGDCITREKFSKLTNFDLNIDCSSIAQNPEFNQLNHEIDFDPHLLSQLEHFSIDFHTRRVPVLMGQLNPGLTFLSFNCNVLPAHYSLPKVEQLDPAFLGEPQFGPSLTHLRLSGAWNLQLKLFCDRFSALQSLQLSACYSHHYFDGKWIKLLNQLEQLEELRLHGFYLESSCLPRVKKLTWFDRWLLSDFARRLCANRSFDGELFCRTVASQFNNLEELILVTQESHVRNTHVQQVRDHLYHFKNLRAKFLNIDG